jgi:hypothetical protein
MHTRVLPVAVLALSAAFGCAAPAATEERTSEATDEIGTSSDELKLARRRPLFGWIEAPHRGQPAEVRTLTVSVLPRALIDDIDPHPLASFTSVEIQQWDRQGQLLSLDVYADRPGGGCIHFERAMNVGDRFRITVTGRDAIGGATWSAATNVVASPSAPITIAPDG